MAANAKDLLRDLAIKSNNLIMQGQFSGDAIHEASQLMAYCLHLVDVIDNEATPENGEQATD